MKEYDLYLPLSYNDGREIPRDQLDRFKKMLLEEFGGFTHFPQENEGVWKFGGALFRDKVIILRVISGSAGTHAPILLRAAGGTDANLGAGGCADRRA